jgi:hypothetical protein
LLLDVPSRDDVNNHHISYARIDPNVSDLQVLPDFIRPPDPWERRPETDGLDGVLVMGETSVFNLFLQVRSPL